MDGCGCEGTCWVGAVVPLGRLRHCPRRRIGRSAIVNVGWNGGVPGESILFLGHGAGSVVAGNDGEALDNVVMCLVMMLVVVLLDLGKGYILGIGVVLVGVVGSVCQSQVCDEGGYNGGRMKTTTLGVVAGRHIETKDG